MGRRRVVHDIPGSGADLTGTEEGLTLIERGVYLSNMVRNAEMTLVSQPQDFFRELVTGALGRQQIEVAPETEFYLVNLLGQFITTDRLYAKNEQGAVREEPLALMLKEALEQVELADRLGIEYAWEVEHHFLEEY